MRKLRKGLQRGVFTLKYRENIGPPCKIAVTADWPANIRSFSRADSVQ
jgi:hypothetical protein